MRFAIVSFILVGCVFSSWLLISSNSRQSSKEELTVGMFDWAPFMAINKTGGFEGFDVDVAEELANRLGKKCKIVDMGALAPLFVALDRNRIDMIFSGLDITEKRRQQMNMVPYSGEDVKEYSLLFWNKIPEGINTIEDLKNYPKPVVVVEPGVSAEKYIEKLDFITKKQIAVLSDRVLDIQYGKSLAVFLEPSIAKRLMAKTPQIKALNVPLPPEFQIFGMGIATKKENTALTEKVQAAILAMKNDGTIKKFEKKWQLSEQSDEV